MKCQSSDAAACLRPDPRALISDLDGTLLAGDRPQPGLLPFLDLLRRRGIALTVVTNNTVRTPAQYSQKLAAAGADVPPEQVLTAAIATAAYLAGGASTGLADLRRRREWAVRCAGRSGLRLAGGQRASRPRPWWSAAIGPCSHDKLKHAIRHVRRGARFIGTNPDLLVPVEDGLAPEAGVLLAAIAAGAGVAPTIIGKPERPLLEQALRLMGSTPAATAILGDRLDTDILGGQRLGLIDHPGHDRCG